MFTITITESKQPQDRDAKPEELAIYMRRVDNIDLGEICAAIDKKPRKPRADKGSRKGAQP